MSNNSKTVEACKEYFKGVKLTDSVKNVTEHNPVMVQHFGADPWALVYKDTVYLYMTADTPEYDSEGKVKENNYSSINKINVISSTDLVNWTDHGSIYAASASGAAKWGGNSWAPAAAYKNIDGKDKFFLYFANSGNGIAVLESDSPVGPFTDPIGGPLISRQTPNCADVTWLFDPAVLIDDDGSAYIYVGGGVPSPDKADNPGTARVCKLGADMISLDGDPKPIENVPYLFEDAGINKFGGRYYYSYCSNFSMTPEATAKLGFGNGTIVTMVSDDPMGPFELAKPVLKNPEAYFGRGGNNHHCMFEFKGEWYIAYHSRILEEAMGMDAGYRSTNVDKLVIGEDGAPVMSVGTKAGVKPVAKFDPYSEVSAVTIGTAAGIETVQYGETAVKCGSGDMILTGLHDGSYTGVFNADFAEGGAKEIVMKVRGEGEGAVRVSLNMPGGPVVAYVPVNAPGAEFIEVRAAIEGEIPAGESNVFFTYAGEGYEVLSWKFVR
ncbi:MAG: family 43 glycosylhydrolase [Lachnospiraceae bacterium]|nr:family 43 glycosylhydrolase [Lachnospiraceae bacterium]